MWLATMLAAAAIAASPPAKGGAPSAPADAPAAPAAAQKATPPSPSVGIEWNGRGRVEYQVSHKLHEVQGVTEEATVRMTTSGDTLEVVAKAPVASFQSGNGNRDRHAMQAIEGDKFPMVEIRGTARGATFPLAGVEARVPLQARVDFHGVTVTQEIPVVFKVAGPNKIEATFEFLVSLEAHKVERPSLFTVKVADAMTVRGTMVLERIVAAAPSASD